MSKNVQIEGLDEVLNSFRNAGTEVHRVGTSWLKSWSNEGVKLSQIEILNAGAVDTNELIQGMNYQVQGTSGGIQSTIKPSETADKYAFFVEEGTRPHWPNIDALRGWANRHGIPVWAVARSIATKGTEPRKMFEKAFVSLDSHVDSELNAFAEAIGRAL